MTTLTIIMLSVPIAIAILAILAEPSIIAEIYTRHCQLIDEPIQPPHDVAYSVLNHGSS
jgi:hypothetical protein